VTEASRINDDVGEQLPGDVQQLAAAIDALPDEYRATLTPVVARVLQSTRRRRRILNLVQEAISQLRLDMKYLVFDLEATRRERDEYRHRLGLDG
jgi:outer membrane murein-binding lipoprotein Lpp